MNLHTSLAGCLAVCFTSCAGVGQRGRIQSADKVDLSRYMGSWRVLACMDNKLERDFVDAVETYQRRADGRIAVHFEWRDKSFGAPVKTHDFTGRVVADGTNARWKMRLFPFFTASYIIVKVAPDYSRVAVAHPSRKFGWILARERTLPAGEFREMVAALEEQGYDTSKLILVPQLQGQKRKLPDDER
jgi:apolipoprotein D and lipocalin family protein